MHTFVAGVFAAVAMPLQLKSIAGLLDNAWSIALERASKAGEALAETLACGAHGDRPVTLVGYSLGARVVFRCLEELARRKLPGVVDTAVLLGAPVSRDCSKWAAARSVVSGRLVNVHNKNDWFVHVFMFI